MMRIAGLLGVIGALMAFAFPVVFGAMDPAYDASRDYISELDPACGNACWKQAC